MDSDTRQIPPEPMELLSDAWCNSALQVFQPSVEDCSFVFKDKQVVAFAGDDRTLTPKNDTSLAVDGGDLKSGPSLKFDDLKSWIWLQKTIHPELDYDLCKRNKWFSKKFPSWKGMSVKKWLKEMKQKRKDEGRLQRAEVHSAISVAAVAAALAAIASENTDGKQQKSLKETAVASAAALVAAQCAQVAEAAGAKREQISSAINAAMTATDATDILTLTAAAATSLRGAATLRGRPGHREKLKGTTSSPLLHDEADFDFRSCRASLAKGDEMYVATEDGKCSFRSVSAVVNRDDKVVLRMKKINVLMAFSVAQESTIYELCTHPLEEPVKEADGYYCIGLKTSRGKVQLKINDHEGYRTWIMTINHMLMLSTKLCRQELQFYRS